MTIVFFAHAVVAVFGICCLLLALVVFVLAFFSPKQPNQRYDYEQNPNPYDFK